MLFYRLSGTTTGAKEIGVLKDKNALAERVRTINIKASAFNQKHEHNVFIFVSCISEESVSIGIINRRISNIDQYIKPFLKAVGLTLLQTSIDEITIAGIKSMLRNSDRGGFIDDDDEILEKLELDSIARCSVIEYSEKLVAPPKNGLVYNLEDKNRLYEQAEHLLMRETINDELTRIYTHVQPMKTFGHPVHYLIQTDDEKACGEAVRILVQALHANSRLPSRRYVTVTVKPGDHFSATRYDNLYKSSIGGAMVVRYLSNDDSESNHASADWETLDKLCELMKKYRNAVLTVLCLPLECTRQKELIRDKLGSIGLVELKDNPVSCKKAKEYLKRLAQERGLRSDRRLYESLSEPNVYGGLELNTIFEEWYSRKLKTDLYPQYKKFASTGVKTVTKQHRGSAYEELMEMIGLDSAKKVIEQALNMQRAQRLFADNGMKLERPSMHMVFTGNPGTAKTTVARLFARIMKENGFLSTGVMVEVGRADLVGKYVGWTAPTIKAKFMEASGGVLFIDEAYSLVDDRDSSFGDEAINTIVQEMENHRKDLIVIFAGYLDKMEQFLRKNPGLRSRIAFHVPFEDYTSEELCQIAGLIARKSGVTLTEDAGEKLLTLFKAAKTEPDFGNGRFVRNMIEQARMSQASRLLKMDYDRVQRWDIETICAENIEISAPKKQEKRQIGF